MTAKHLLDQIERGLDGVTATCETCKGRGEVGGHRGQTAESYEEYSEPCPDCTTHGFLFDLASRLRKIPVSMGVDGYDIDRLISAGRSFRDLEERLAKAAEALEPFAEFAYGTVDEIGWTDARPRERISMWFGPSDFRRARTALTTIRRTA